MPETVIEVLDETARSRPQAVAMRHKEDGSWVPTTWQEYRDEVRLAARGLVRLGAEPGNGIVIIGFNRPQWFVADLAAIAAGALPVGIYTTSSADQYQYIAHHCGARVAVVENREYLDRILEVRDRLPQLEAIVMMTGEASEPGVLTWAELLAAGEEVAESTLDQRLAVQRRDDLCTLIYTSGTTGPPKAVALTHHNLIWTTARLAESYDIRDGDRVLSYLPLSHIAEQVVSLHTPLLVGATSWFAESLEKLGENLREARPSFFFAVPRVWEKIQAAMEAAGAQNPPLKRKIAAWARRKGAAASIAEQTGGSPPAFLGLADKLVFSKVRDKLGLSEARICATSAAPISLGTLEFFASLGIPIMEVYGMSECTGPATFSYPDRYRLGRAGLALPGAEIRIAEDGEILMRGPHVFPGYYRNEDATAETLDEQGWLHSGDIGDLDEDGFLSVTDRKKELLITSGGKNIAPANLEKELRRIPAISQAVAVGEKRNYVAAIVTLDPEQLPGALQASGSAATDAAGAAACPVFHQWLETRIEEVNSRLARYEGIKRFSILPEDFSIEGGELTPTMKLKRRVIYDKYAVQIDDLYS